jgi:hypothetical protein
VCWRRPQRPSSGLPEGNVFTALELAALGMGREMNVFAVLDVTEPGITSSKQRAVPVNSAA